MKKLIGEWRRFVGRNSQDNERSSSGCTDEVITQFGCWTPSITSSVHHEIKHVAIIDMYIHRLIKYEFENQEI
jgi:hypothetical protein